MTPKRPEIENHALVGEALIYLAEGLRPLTTLSGHTEDVTAVAIAPDSSFLVSGSEDNTLKVWDLATGEELITFVGESAFNCCAVTPDRKTIVAGDAGGQVHFLQIEGV